MTRLFLDCEWADTRGSDLVSIGLVADDGQHRFYSEVSPLPPNPTHFVSEVVYPLLEHGVQSRARVTMAYELRTFSLGSKTRSCFMTALRTGSFSAMHLQALDCPNLS